MICKPMRRPFVRANLLRRQEEMRERMKAPPPPKKITLPSPGRPDPLAWLWASRPCNACGSHKLCECREIEVDLARLEAIKAARLLAGREGHDAARNR